MLPEGVRHQPFYCEENVFHLCAHRVLAGRRKSVVFVSGVMGGCVMWHQRAARRPGVPVYWDYHVFVLADEPCEVWDLDTTLAVPIAATDYLERSFRVGLPAELAPVFRVIDTAQFVETLATDRSHMKRRDGSYERPPPPWPVVSPPERGSNLHRFIDMRVPFIGEVLSLDDLTERVARAG